MILAFRVPLSLLRAFRKGQTLAILGPNGAGKSTLLKALSGVLPLSKGERVEGEGLKLGVFTQASGVFYYLGTVSRLSGFMYTNVIGGDLVLQRIGVILFT